MYLYSRRQTKPKRSKLKVKYNNKIFVKINEKVKINVLGIGTLGMGGWILRDNSRDKECIDAIKTAIKLGMTHIDTAEVYGNGHTEELIGEAIKDVPRKKLFITTKVYKNHLHYNDVIQAAKNSLKRMRTNYIDLYLIHWPNHKVSLKETMKAMDFLVENKLVRFIGVSNFSLNSMKKAQSYTKNKIVANQVEYNILQRCPEKNLLDYCQKNGILLIAYRPLAGGKLVRGRNKLLDELCRKYKKTRAQIVLNWLISKDNVITIPKASVQHIKENCGAIGWHLSKEDSKKIEKYFWKFWFFSNLFRKPLRFLGNVAINILPEKNIEKIELSYDNLFRKLRKLHMR